ncbi:MAG: GNAT family N-acetyltransferase [Candidatus Paceibacterota bacterium]
MVIRDFTKEDKEQVEKIFSTYWNDPVFLRELTNNLDAYTKKTDVDNKEMYRFYVAEEAEEIVGIAGFRKAPDYLRIYADTDKPAEFYILASKYKRRGIGEALRLKRIEEAKKLGFTEILFYSPETHEDSWVFHDKLGFKRNGLITDPDGYPGMIWKMTLA